MMSTKDARAWVDHNVAALLRIAREGDHEWLFKGPDGKPLDEFARRRVARAVELVIKKGG
jgi:hypothetical protein